VGHEAVGGKHKASGSSGIRRLKNMRWGHGPCCPPCGSAPAPGHCPCPTAMILRQPAVFILSVSRSWIEKQFGFVKTGWLNYIF
jgi:hypothetical protein